MITNSQNDHRRILVIEDDRDDFFLINDTLMSVEGQPYRASWCSCYEDAQALLQEQKFELALVDYQIGAKTGLDFIKEVGPFHLNCPMILLTGLRSPDIDKAAQDAGAADYLPKDLLSAELLDRSIRYTLEHSKRLSLLRSILQNATSGMIAVDNDMVPVIWNLQALRALDFDKPFNWVSREELIDKLEELFEDKTVPAEFENSKGTIFEIKITMVDGVGHLIAFNDISEHVAEGKNLRQTAQSAEEAYQTQSHLIAKVSHELRTPIHGIVGMVELLSRGEINDEQRRSLGTIKHCSESLLKLINDLLDLSKFEAGEMKANDVPYKVGDVVDSVVQLLAPTAFEKGLEISAFVDPAVTYELRGDPDRLTQVLMNLVGNAIKFTEAGEVSLTVAGAVSGGTSMIECSVSDTGPGIAESDTELLFQRFKQIDTTASAATLGTGLGLSLCKEIVELLGGEISCTSQLGRGSSFRFCIPAVPADSLQQKIVLRHGEALRANSFLVVAPETGARQNLVSYLEQLGGAVVCAASQQVASDILQSQSPDHLIFDRYVDGNSAEVLIRQFQAGPKQAHSTTFHLGAGRGHCAQTAAAFDVLLPRPLDHSTIRLVHQSIQQKQGSRQERTSVAQPCARQPSTGKQQRSLRVMVVDDNEPNRIVANAMLSGEGYSPIIAASGPNAIELSQENHVDVILMDICMPGMDGLETTQQIRSMEFGHQLSIIGLTAGYNDTNEAANALDAILPKPVDWDELVNILNELDEVVQANLPADDQVPMKSTSQGHHVEQDRLGRQQTGPM